MSKKIEDGLTRYQRYYRSLTAEEKEKRRQRVAQWRANNPERTKLIARASYSKNADQRRADSVVASKARRQRIVGTDNYRAAERARTQRRRAVLQGVSATLTEQEWQQILSAHNHQCAYCGCSGIKLEQDHVLAISKGGEHTKENVVPACKPCNSSKRDRPAPLRRTGRAY